MSWVTERHFDVGNPDVQEVFDSFTGRERQLVAVGMRLGHEQARLGLVEALGLADTVRAEELKRWARRSHPEFAACDRWAVDAAFGLHFRPPVEVDG